MSLPPTTKGLLIITAVLCLSTALSQATGLLPNQRKDSKCNDIPQDCTEIRDCTDLCEPHTSPESGIYTIQPITYPEPFFVYCDMETDGGGWTIFQKRRDDTVNFYRNWADYKEGFGLINTNYWLGNDKLSYLTAQGNYQLRIDMTDFEGESRYAVYDNFQIGDESKLYKLYIGEYSGNAGNSLGIHKGMNFTTRDHDNDIRDSGNCATIYKGAWWYKSCHHSNLNGLYLEGPHDAMGEGINWKHWHDHYYSLKTTQMKVRRQP